MNRHLTQAANDNTDITETFVNDLRETISKTLTKEGFRFRPSPIPGTKKQDMRDVAVENITQEILDLILDYEPTGGST